VRGQGLILRFGYATSGRFMMNEESTSWAMRLAIFNGMAIDIMLCGNQELPVGSKGPR